MQKSRKINGMTPAALRLELLHLVVTLEAKKGHLQWKVSDLARKAGISRTLLYYHLGKTKKDILDRCIELIAEDLYGLGSEHSKQPSAEDVVEGVISLRRRHSDCPALFVFYLKWRSQPSPMQERLIQFEKRFAVRLQKQYPHLTKSAVSALHGIFHGLITAPFLAEPDVREALKAIQAMLGAN